MLKNYFRIALRNLGKYKFISFVNLFGLTVGMTCCLIILTYILNETSYEKYNPNAGRTQFSISIILIISTAVVFQQLHYMQNKSLGFSKEQIVTLPYSRDLHKNFESFRTELLQNANIKNTTRSSRIPGGRLLDEQGASMQHGDSLVPVVADIKYVSTDFDFTPTYGIPIVAGRNFSRAYLTDTNSFLLNEAAVKVLNFKD